ncbi:hypothetical protein ES705_09351 [subsurface metagenome]
MRYIESPKTYTESDKNLSLNDRSLFLAGGISGCENWQSRMALYLRDLPIVLLNPRRKDFPIDDPEAAQAQIEWEYNHLRRASMILFWFPFETLCPIVLYELGAWSMTDKKIFVGVHPEYKRRQDVEIQTKLVRPEVQIVYDLGSLLEQIISECR